MERPRSKYERVSAIRQQKLLNALIARLLQMVIFMVLENGRTRQQQQKLSTARPARHLCITAGAHTGQRDQIREQVERRCKIGNKKVDGRQN